MTRAKHTDTSPNPSDLCMCGCGEPAPIADRTYTRLGVKKGESFRFVLGHAPRVRKRQPEPLRYEVDANGCHLFLGHINNKGYGRVTRNQRQVYAHRLSYEASKGPIPKGYDLDHLCRNPRCINPDHLEPVTHGENMRRGWSAKKEREVAHSSSLPTTLPSAVK